MDGLDIHFEKTTNMRRIFLLSLVGITLLIKPLWAVTPSNDAFTSEILESVWSEWVTATREISLGYKIAWDEQDETADYIANNCSEWLISHGYSQPTDDSLSLTITIKNAAIDFTISRGPKSQYGEYSYEREMQVRFDIEIVETTGNAPLKNEHYDRTKTDTFGEDDLTFVLDDPFVVEPRVRFPVAGLSLKKVALVSTITIVIAALLYFVRL